MRLTFLLSPILLQVFFYCSGHAQNSRPSKEVYSTIRLQLDTVMRDDQSLRMQLDSVEKLGWNSPDAMAHWKKISYNDSVNLIKVQKILDTHGWLGAEEIGETGNSALFLVIQHSGLDVQEKYLPMMREAVKKGKAKGRSLALLEDRILLRKGGKQIYGSQIGQNPETQEYYVQPLEDPANVDKRRADVGLPPMSEYLKSWDLEWSTEEYEKGLERMKKK